MKPVIGITMGDPASIGPEITTKVLGLSKIYENCNPVVIGETSIMNEAVRLTCSNISINPITNVSEAKFSHGTIDVLDMGIVNMSKVTPGKISAITGEASFRYVEKVIKMAMDNEIDATVTNAISKEAINLANHKYAGHTEIYATLTNTKKYTMLLVHEHIRVVHVSTHVSLRQACDLVKKDRVLEVIHLANKACKAIGIDAPKIAVTGLNPHSGEEGMFGTEEIDEIIPAINEAQSQGVNVEGPIPPDTVFPKARGKWYDIVVAMYHDQGHIPLKLEGFIYDVEKKAWTSVSGVNITLGLPIIRTSVDHGTAMDMAYRNTASPTSLKSAVEYAIKMAISKNHD